MFIVMYLAMTLIGDKKVIKELFCGVSPDLQAAYQEM